MRIYGTQWYGIAVLNVAWWAASGRKQRAASDIDISIRVCGLVCVASFIIKVLNIYTYSIYICVCVSVWVIGRKNSD